ncbi:MAG: hypothetical protein MUC50_21150 [Myxococcota bacterium]|jgi:hypothetical protein|nr:hypothetical protein [Myxococcota bacterium]
MSPHTYTEDQLVEQPAIGLFAERDFRCDRGMEGAARFSRRESLNHRIVRKTKVKGGCG